MTITIEATYENGVLKPAQPLALREHEKVLVTIADDPAWRLSRVQATAGMIRWTGDPAELERIAMDPEFGILESP